MFHSTFRWHSFAQLSRLQLRCSEFRMSFLLFFTFIYYGQQDSGGYIEFTIPGVVNDKRYFDSITPAGSRLTNWLQVSYTVPSTAFPITFTASMNPTCTCYLNETQLAVDDFAWTDGACA